MALRLGGRFPVAGDLLASDDDDIAIMSNSIKLSAEHDERYDTSRPSEWTTALPPRFNSITLDDDDFESIDLLARTRPPRAPDRAAAASRLRVMGTTSVLAVCFFNVCSGPLGPETVMADDPVTGTLFLVLFPLLCSGPFAAVIAELCSSLPEDGGFVVWALNAFGPVAAFQTGYWAWLASVFGRAYRVALAFNLLVAVFDLSPSWAVGFALRAAAAIVFTVPSLLGTKVLSRTLLVVLLGCVVAPYAVLTAWGYSQASIVPNTAIKTSTGASTDWVGLGNTLFWSFDGFHLVAAFGGRVLNPARAFPHAIYFTFLTIYVAYLLPTLASYSAVREQWRQLTDWSFPALANTIGGRALHGLIVFATVAGLLGSYMAQVFSDGYQLSGMAEMALVPLSLKKRTQQFGSPHISIGASLVAVVAVTACDFDLLLSTANTFSALTQFVIIAAALELRRSLPFMPRPAKVPGGIPLILLVSVVPTLLLGYLVVHTLLKPRNAVVVGTFVAIGVLLSVFRRCQRRRLNRFF